MPDIRDITCPLCGYKWWDCDDQEIDAFNKKVLFIGGKMKAKLMAHRMRTQRLGENSVAHEVYIATDEIGELRELAKLLRKEQKRVAKTGYPFDSELLDKFHTCIYDDYYIVVK